MWTSATLLALSLVVAADAGDAGVGNRLTYLDEFCDPYCVGLDSARLTTPQWVGDDGVEAVVVLANDDLKELGGHAKYFRPIMRRLKEFDADSGVSLMATQIPPDDPQIQAWLKEDVNVEAHTWTHPCPCLQGGELAKAKATFDECIDNLRKIPGGRTVGYRMPCCDSMNSVSPRFFVEIFNKTTPGGNFLSVDSSVFQLITSDDPDLPRELVLDDGKERFRKYVPTDRLMVNLIENYPYPYVIGRMVWEVPCLMPSDWDAQHLNGKCSPKTVADLKQAVDATVIKRGIFSLCFHTHGWIANEQVIEVIDHAAAKHGRRIKFLNFHQMLQRLNRNLLGGHPIRAANGQDNGVRLVDLNNDGFLDVVIGNEKLRQTRVWSPADGEWITGPFPVEVVSVDDRGNRTETGVRFGVLQENGNASFLVRNEKTAGIWDFDGRKWIARPDGLAGLESQGPIATSELGRDTGVRMLDLNRDGICELVVANPKQNAVFGLTVVRGDTKWQRLPFALPRGATIVDDQGRDAGLRFVDFDEDGRLDVVFSNADRYLACAFNGMQEGWSRKTLDGKQGDRKGLPMIVRADGTNNGAWFKYRHMWVQNEDTTVGRETQVESRSFTADLVAEPVGQTR